MKTIDEVREISDDLTMNHPFIYENGVESIKDGVRVYFIGNCDGRLVKNDKIFPYLSKVGYSRGELIFHMSRMIEELESDCGYGE